MRLRTIKFPELAKALAVDPRPQYVVATAAGLAPTSLSAILSGRAPASLKHRDAIAAALGVDAQKLFSEK